MASHWILRDPLSAYRALRLRMATRHGYSVSDQPAFDPETAAWFQERLNSLNHYVEYGSGASTVLAARRGIPLVSMESDPRYAAAVRKVLPASADATILDAKLGATEYWGYPVFTRRSADRLARWQYYARAPMVEAESRGWLPELVLVDGRFRCACALAAAQTILAKGAQAEIIFDDYAGRPYYEVVEKYLGRPTMIGRAALFVVGLGVEDGLMSIEDTAVAHFAQDFR
jgi:hypothetical protein